MELYEPSFLTVSIDFIKHNIFNLRLEHAYAYAYKVTLKIYLNYFYLVACLRKFIVFTEILEPS